MNLSRRPAEPDQMNAIYGIMALAGEHMHRALGLSHWHPFPSSEQYLARMNDHNMQAVYVDDYLVGCFTLSTHLEPYYLPDMSAYWEDLPSMYFSGFGILPSHQQQGIGTWCMNEVDKMVVAQGYDRVRFDAVASHPKLLKFYTRLGYIPHGLLPIPKRPNVAVMCFQKVFENAM